MARTIKKNPPNPYRKEDAKHRTAHQRAFRSAVRNLMARDEFENLPRFRRTSGWLTH